MSGDWKRAYEAQMETWRWERSDLGRRSRLAHLRDNMEGMSKSTRELLAILYSVEEDKLLHADPFFVSREMCEVIDAASATFEPEPLLQTDFLTEVGFLYFERPFILPDRYDLATALSACSWSPMWSKDEETGETKDAGIALTLYANPSAIPHIEADDPRNFPEATPIHMTPWWYGMTLDGNEFDEAGKYTGVERWWKVIQTALRLMQQKITVRHQERPDRATRRRAERLGFHEREVVLVKLRRESNHEPGDGPHENANYSHRFIVSGHWRNQWYPSAHVHRQIWISPYVKGPEDQPLVIRPRRVFSVVR